MDAAVIAALKVEEARLETELQAMPAYRRLQAVRTSIAALNAAYEIGQSLSGETHSHENPVQTRRYRPRSDSLSAQVSALAEALFRETNRRFKSPALFSELQTRGLGPIAVQNPVGAIASVMSHSEIFNNAFDSHGSGYGLREWSANSNLDLSADTEAFGDKPASDA